MAAPAAEKSGQTAKVVRCEACNAVFRNVAWTEGSRCPRCRSPRFVPLLIAGDALDYMLADRSQGYALEDIRFAKITQWAGLISAQQYHEAFNRQKEYLGAEARVPPIGEIMRNLKWLKKIGIQAVLAYRCLPRPDDDDSEFAKLALQSKFVEQDKLAECMDAQREIQRAGHDVPPLPCLLYEKRYLQENQVQALLQKQAESGSGLIHRVQEYVRQHSRATMDQLLGPKGSKQRKLRAALAAALVVFAVWKAGSSLIEAQTKMVKTMCTEPACSQISAKPANADWPARCDACPKHGRTVFPVSICEKCGREYVNDKPNAVSARCPHCGSTRVIRLIDDSVNVREIQLNSQKKQEGT
jgi:Zn finger protein HypA/HybF involved in hydrogenase expression